MAGPRIASLMKIPRRVIKRQEVERVRESIPVDVLLQCQTCAALTGKMPRLDMATGQPARDPETGEGLVDTLGPKERIQVTQYLIDKRMPTVKQIESTDAGAPDEEDLGTELANQTNEQLLRQVQAVDADFETEDDITAGWDEA